jgi:PIN domain nuclease of toxin-antitoxin system
LDLRYLLDTHIVLRWIAQPQKLSFEQRRIVRRSEQRGQPIGVSAITLYETAVLFRNQNATAKEMLDSIEINPLFQILPLTTEIAVEMIALTAVLRDPADCAIVASARIHGLRLLTVDQRIIQSRLVPVVE